MTLLILMIFLVFISSIHGDFNTTHLDLEITAATFSATDSVSKNDVIVDMNNQSKLVVHLDVKDAANDGVTNQSSTISTSTVGPDNTTARSDPPIDSSQTTTTTTTTAKLDTASIALQTGDFSVLLFAIEHSNRIILLR